MKRGTMVMAAALGMGVLGACSESNTIGDQLLGTWNLAAYAAGSQTAVTTGTWTFFEDATFLALGSITYEGEPTDSLDVEGEWQEQGPASITLTVAGETTLWNVTIAPDTAVLELPDPEGTVRVTLAK